MNFYDTRTSYLQLKEELSKIKTQADFHQVENHIKENLVSLDEKQLTNLIEAFNEKGGNLDLQQTLKLKEEIETDDFDLDVEDEEYVDIDDDENLIEEDAEDNPEDYKTVVITDIEPYYTLDDIDPMVASELDMYPDDYLAQCKDYIRTYFKETLGDPFYLDVPVDYLESESELEDYIEETISDLTGYLVDSYNYKIFDEDIKKDDNQDEEQVEVETEDVQESIKESEDEPNDEDLNDNKEIDVNDTHKEDLQQLFNVYVNEGKRILPSNSEGVRDMIENSSLNQLSAEQLVDLVNTSDLPFKAKMYGYKDGKSFKLFTTRKWYIENCIKLNTYKWAVRNSNSKTDDLDLDDAINQFKTYTTNLYNKWNDANDNQYIGGFSILFITFPDKNIKIPILSSNPELRAAFANIGSLSKQETDESKYAYNCLPKAEQDIIKSTYDELNGLLKKDTRKINPITSEYIKVEENPNEDTNESLDECDNKPKSRYKIEKLNNSKEGENK